MTEHSTSGSHEDGQSPTPPLPENLAALVGALHGPADLGRNRDALRRLSREDPAIARNDREQSNVAP